MVLLVSYLINIANNTVLVSLFNLMNSLTILNKLIKCSNSLRNNIVGFSILLSQKSIDVFDELHGDNLMRKLVIVFVKIPSKLKIKDKRVPVLGFNEKTIFNIDVY